MIPRIISLILVAALAAISLGTMESAPPDDKMDCCMSESSDQRCPDCPKDTGSHGKCCCVPLVVLFFLPARPLIHSFSTASYVVFRESYPSQTTTPLLPPPKIS
ncbi:MAG: hypothetical protein ACOYMS_01800 [Terrimicrobiaceae bacterium]